MLTRRALLIMSGGWAYASKHPALVQTEGEKIAFFKGQKPLFEYRYSSDRPRPYIHPLYAPDGSPITIDSPKDHPHHRGLMLGWNNVNGFQFWGEGTSEQGVIVHQRFEQLRDKPPASLIALNHWIANDRALLAERCTIRALALAPECVSLEWESELKALDEPVTLSANKHPYDGLGIRFVPGMDKGNVLNAKGTARIERANGEEAVWCTYYGGSYGVAIFDHPANPRHPTPFFVMNQPFGYLSAAPTFRDPLFRLNSGESLRLRWGVIAYSGVPDRDRLDRLYKKWTA